MTKKEKRFEDLQNLKADASFQVIKIILEENGYRLTASKGSHFRFKKANKPSISIPVHQGKVKKVYIKEILKLIQL